MGTWGTSIFSDDFASDIKNEFRDLIGIGKSPEVATNEIIETYKDELINSEESSVFWIALSAIQWQLGRLQHIVKQNAIEIIDSEVDLQRWIDNPKDLNKRKIVLSQLKEKLLSKQPAARKVAIPFVRTTKLEAGDVVAYHLTNGKVCVLRVVSISQDHCGDRYPRVEIVNYYDSRIPEVEYASKLDILKGVDLDLMKSSDTIEIAPYGKSNLEPWEKLICIAKGIETKSNHGGTIPLIWWRDFDSYILSRFESKTPA